MIIIPFIILILLYAFIIWLIMIPYFKRIGKTFEDIVKEIKGEKNEHNM